MSPARADRCLVWLLRVVGGLLLCALPAVPLSASNMVQVHQDLLAMGALPTAPIVVYLARTASMLYAMHGAVMLFASLDIPRYRPLIVLLGTMNGLFGLTCLAIDLTASMPIWWTVTEGPIISGVAAVTIALAWRGRTRSAE